MVRKQHLWIALALTIVAAPVKAETIQVTIDKLVFSPATVEAKVGDTIEWVNKDVFAHTATVKGGWEVMIPPKKSASLTLKAAESGRLFLPLPPQHEGPHQGGAIAGAWDRGRGRDPTIWEVRRAQGGCAGKDRVCVCGRRQRRRHSGWHAGTRSRAAALQRIWFVGSSVGALNEAYYAGDPTIEGNSTVETIWRELCRRDVFPFTWKTMIGFIVPSRFSCDVGPAAPTLRGKGLSVATNANEVDPNCPGHSSPRSSKRLKHRLYS